MKRWCAMLLVLLLAGTVVGCGKEETNANLAVTIELPREMIDIEGDEALVAKAQKEGMEASVADGVVTYHMTPERQQEILLSYKTTFEEELPTVIDQGMIPGALDISYNDDMTEFTVTADAEVFDVSMNGMPLGILYTTGMGYQLYAGVPDEKIDVRVRIVDQATKEELGQFSMREVFAQQQVPGDDSD